VEEEKAKNERLSRAEVREGEGQRVRAAFRSPPLAIVASSIWVLVEKKGQGRRWVLMKLFVPAP
jgi:hypothetical protein